MMQMQSRGRVFGGAAPQTARQSVVVVRAESRREGGLRQTAEQIVRKVQIPALAKPAMLAAVTNMIATLPAHAEAGKIFDFNLTLPIMAGQFLLLMVFLEKTWFSPVGKVLDERDKKLRDMLGSVKDNSTELQTLQKEAEEVIAAARAEASKVIQDAKRASDAEIQAAVDETKKKLDQELEQALATLAKEQEGALAGVDSKVDTLVQEVLNRVLPEGVKA
jgi:F-type H+-transporting ATPase subunit b